MASKIKVDAIETTTGSGSIAINNTLSGFTSTGIDDNATSTAITIDSSENVGIGVVPESWNSSFNILQISKGYLAKWGTSGSGEFEVGNNAYYDTGYKYQEDGHATKMHQQNGEIKFQVAPSGTADSAITWTTALDIKRDGRGLSQFTAKAWVNFNGSGTVAIRDSHNVSSITDNGTGVYTPNMSNALSNANYSISGVAGRGYGEFMNVIRDDNSSAQTTSAFRINILQAWDTWWDATHISVIVFGD
jgi:hypothetical protein